MENSAADDQNPDSSPVGCVLLKLDAVSKSYGGVRALDQVSLTIDRGEVHALCGENGAGKSTLIKILTGTVRPESGVITLDGKRLVTGDVRASEAAGIAVIHQESTSFPDLNAVDNIFVGREIGTCRGWNMNYRAMQVQTQVLLQQLGETMDITRPIGELPLAQRQMVSMARALAGNCRLLIMDEPTASLSARETDVLFKLIRRLRGEGISILYVSHRLEEIFSIADRITVLRDGRWVQTEPTEQVTREQLVQQMVGRPLQEMASSETVTQSSRTGPLILEVNGLSQAGRFRDVSLTVRAGEVVGLAGLVGAGRSEVARAIFGIDPYDAGEVIVNGQRLVPESVRASMNAGLALVPEDRQQEGLILPLSIRSNVSLAMLPRLRRFGGVSFRRERELVQGQLDSLRVKCDGMRPPAATMSGGNQQKLVLGKWLATRPKLLILDEPTRGIDVGAKSQFHDLIRQFAEQDLAVLLISSDLPELISLCDRLLVMRAGQIVGELTRSEANQARVLELALPDGQSSVGRVSHG